MRVFLLEELVKYLRDLIGVELIRLLPSIGIPQGDGRACNGVVSNGLRVLLLSPKEALLDHSRKAQVVRPRLRRPPILPRVSRSIIVRMVLNSLKGSFRAGLHVEGSVFLNDSTTSREDLR